MDPRTHPIRVGQIWRDRDKRVALSRVVLSYEGEGGFVRLGYPGVTSGITRVRVTNLRARFRLLKDAPESRP